MNVSYFNRRHDHAPNPRLGSDPWSVAPEGLMRNGLLPLIFAMIYPLRRLIFRSNNAYRYYARRGFHSSWPSYAKRLEKFKLADIGEGITECEIIKWYEYVQFIIWCIITLIH
jgi:hypothetical protein